jgi:hypothetical protein
VRAALRRDRADAAALRRARPRFPRAQRHTTPILSHAPRHAAELLAAFSAAMQGQDPSRKGNSVLVVDDFALGVINACVSQQDLLKAGFISVCPFETKKELAAGLRRRRYDKLDVLYFMRPKKANLARVVDDYKADAPPPSPDLLERFFSLFPCIFKGIPELEGEPAMYADARLLLLAGPQQKPGVHNWQLAHEFFESSIAARGAELARLGKAWVPATRVKDVPIEFMALDASLFSLDMHDTLSTVYTHALAAGTLDDEELEAVRAKVFEHLDVVAHRLAMACVALNEVPFVRWSFSARGVSESVARETIKQLKAYREMHPGFRPWGDVAAREEARGGGGAGRAPLRPGEPPEPAVLIVVDRVDDLAPALLHDIAYSTLTTDLLDHEPGTPFHFEYKRKKELVAKTVLLNETDPVWRNLRHEDMGTVIDAVDDGVRAANARDARRRELDASDIGDLRELMSTLMGDEKLIDEKFALHYRMKQAIVEKFENRNFHELLEIEQTLVCGCSAAGEHTGSKALEASLRTLMRDERLSSSDQARLLALFILTAKSIDAKLRNELLAASHMDAEHKRAIANLIDVHVPIARTTSEPRAEAAPFFDDATLKRNKKAARAWA